MSFLPRATLLFACSVLLAQEVFALGVENESRCELRVSYQYKLLKERTHKCKGTRRPGDSGPLECNEVDRDLSGPEALWDPSTIFLTPNEYPELASAVLPEVGQVVGVEVRGADFNLLGTLALECEPLNQGSPQDPSAKEVRCGIEGQGADGYVRLWYRPAVCDASQPGRRDCPEFAYVSNISYVIGGSLRSAQTRLKVSDGEWTQERDETDWMWLDLSPIGLGLVPITHRLRCTSTHKLVE